MKINIWQKVSFITMGAMVVLGAQVLLSHRAGAQLSPLSSALVPTPVGSWYGQALPIDPKTAPFPAVWMMPTFFADGNVIANDSHELNSPHTTAHGNWAWTSPTTIHCTMLWINYGPLGTPDGMGGNFRVSFDGTVDPKNPDSMTVTLHPLAFAPGQDPLNPKTVPAVDGGIFVAKALTRIRQSKY
jgi:hypothetical protein